MLPAPPPGPVPLPSAYFTCGMMLLLAWIVGAVTIYEFKELDFKHALILKKTVVNHKHVQGGVVREASDGN